MLSLSLPGRVFLVHAADRHAQELRFAGGAGADAPGPGSRCRAICSCFAPSVAIALKLLYWDSDGLRHLVQTSGRRNFRAAGRGRQAGRVGEHGLVLRPAELAMLLDGIDLVDVKRQQALPTAGGDRGRHRSRFSVTYACH